MLKVISTVLCSIGLSSLVNGQGISGLPSESPLQGMDKTMPALELMPPGSVLKRVSMPRYQGTEMSLLVTSEKMVVVSNREMSGETVFIYLYKLGQQTTKLHARDASYFFDTCMVISKGRTTMDDEKVSLEGKGIYFDTKLKKGIMTGPVTTEIKQLPKNP